MMKKSIIYLLLFYIILGSFGCEENFDPFTDGKDAVILNCILRSDTTLQMVYISKSYKPVGFDPYPNTEDHFVKNAKVKVWLGDTVYTFRDTLIKRADTSRYKNDIYCYYSNGIRLLNRTKIEIEATLDNGKKFSAVSNTPAKISFSSVSADVISAESKNMISISWENTSAESYYYPRMLFSYYKTIDGQQVRFTKSVPVEYYQEGGKITPHYPQPGYSSSLNISKKVIEKALLEISDGDPIKSNYTINEYVYVEVLSFDNNLTRYYSSTQTLDNLSISVDGNDFTNVNGGLGIFASMMKDTYRLKFFSQYVTALGYKFNSGN